MTDLPGRFQLAPTLLAIALGLSACQSSQPFDAGLTPAPGQADQPNVRSPAALMIDGDLIPWQDLRPFLAEAAGAQAIEELLLDRVLEARARQAGIKLSREQIDAEGRYLRASVRLGSGLEGEDAARAIDLLRTSRGLGPRRYRALLRRNALLRAMVRPSVTLPQGAVEQAYRLRYGPMYRVRVILVPRERQAAQILDQVRAAGDAGLVRFAELAAEQSTDASAAMGGLIESISPADPSYPEEVRRLLPRLEAGQVSPVIAVDNGYALIYMERPIPESGPPIDEVRQSLGDELRSRHDRLAMEDLARRLVFETRLTVLDPSLNWAWEHRPAAPRR